MTRYVFPEVRVFGRKSGRCTVCGKHAERSKKFWQTENPWNKNEDGSVRTRADIYAVINAEARAWEAEPVTHRRCES